MPVPRTYLTRGLVLKNTPFGEADLLVSLYSREFGKIRALAKGTRKPTSRMVGHLEPLTILDLSLFRGRNLDTINQAQIVNNLSNLKSDLSQISEGLYVCELMDGFGNESNSNIELYQVAIETLENIDRDHQQDLSLRWFEIHLLRTSGFKIELETCIQCNCDIEPQQHRFSPDSGGVLCLHCNITAHSIYPLSLQALKVLRFLERNPLNRLPHLNISNTLKKELKLLLGNTVRYWIDKEIRSNAFIEHLEHLK
ncbi:MAG: DNA repair protein RecO [Chloroflexota bacterium]|nr:DNA repair protein RecO [Chloroflexota bacterium]